MFLLYFDNQKLTLLVYSPLLIYYIFWKIPLYSLISPCSSIPELRVLSGVGGAKEDTTTGVNISHENRNYSDRDPKNFKTFPKFLKKFRSQITVISRRFHRFFILLLKHHFWKMENFSENSQNFETIPTGFRSA